MILSIYLFLCANSVATIVAYYQKCYDSLSLCLITNIDDGREFTLNRSSAERWCKDHSSSLATITNVTVQSAIDTFINDARIDSSTDVITNGYRYNFSEWEWINGARSDYRSGFRYNVMYMCACLFVSAGGPYISICAHTSSKEKFICTYRLSSSRSCSQGYTRTGTICYKIHQQKAAWFKARSLCLREDGSDLAVFDEGLPSITSNESERYWIGLRTEKWTWWNGQGNDEIANYSNWDGWSPGSLGENCLCVRTRTGEWKECDCSQNYRYICIQDYATGSSLTFKPTTKKTTTRTTKPATATTKLKTTHSTTVSAGNSSPFMFLSTPTHALDDNSRSDVSEDPLNTHESGPTSVIVLSTLIVLVVLIVVITVVSAIVIKKRRKRSTRQEVVYVNSAFQPTSSVDDYTTLRRECLTGNETYAELNVYETIEDEIYKNSK